MAMLGRASMTGSNAARSRPDLHHPVPQQVGAGTEPAHLGILATQGLDHQGGVERLVGDLGHLGPQIAGPRRPPPASSAGTGSWPPRWRAGGEADEGQERVGDDQQDAGDEQHQDSTPKAMGRGRR
jgi:hypothetical protein